MERGDITRCTEYLRNHICPTVVILAAFDCHFSTKEYDFKRRNALFTNPFETEDSGTMTVLCGGCESKPLLSPFLSTTE